MVAPGLRNARARGYISIYDRGKLQKGCYYFANIVIYFQYVTR